MKVLSFPTKGNIGLKRKHYSWRIEVVSWGGGSGPHFRKKLWRMKRISSLRSDAYLP